MAEIKQLFNLPQITKDSALVVQIAESMRDLQEIPAEDLADLVSGDSSAYMTLFCAHQALMEKLEQMATIQEARRFNMDLIESGRARS